MPAMRLVVSLFLLGAAFLQAVEPAPRPRPAEWAVPMINVALENCYRVSDELYRCEQPALENAANLHALGIRSILNLRNFHKDSREFETVGYTLLIERMEA